MTFVKVARGLGWFSIGLGLTELILPGALGRFLGTRRFNLLRIYGLRELAAGIGILGGALRPFLWSRVAGDVIDLASLGAAFRGKTRRTQRINLALATAAVVGVTGLDVLAGVKVHGNMQRL